MAAHRAGVISCQYSDLASQGIITKDNVSVDVSAVAYFRVVGAVKSVVAIENVGALASGLRLHVLVMAIRRPVLNA